VQRLEEAVPAQLMHLNARGDDSLAVWMAYDYVRDYMLQHGQEQNRSSQLPDLLKAYMDGEGTGSSSKFVV